MLDKLRRRLEFSDGFWEAMCIHLADRLDSVRV